MAVLSNLEPKKVFYYFEEITKIPHGSGNVEQISDFLVDFAKAHNLFYIQDAMKNVIIVKEATPGYENEPVVILQGHMDMVAVQTPECTMDMKTEGLKIGIDGDNIYAEGTSLGGDDGIAVAYALAGRCQRDRPVHVTGTSHDQSGFRGRRHFPDQLCRWCESELPFPDEKTGAYGRAL